MSGFRDDPLPIGTGLLAALTLPKGVEELVIPAVVAELAAEVETLLGDMAGGIEGPEEDSGKDGDSREREEVRDSSELGSFELGSMTIDSVHKTRTGTRQDKAYEAYRLR